MTGETVTRDQIVSQCLGVSGCARCSDVHAVLVWKAFECPPVFEGVTVTHWATCPTTDDPILLTCKEEQVPVERTLVAVFSQEDPGAVRRQYEHQVPGETKLHVWKEAPGGE